MGDSGSLAELRGILVAVTFISLFVVLVGWIPYQFVYPTSGQQSVDVPDSARMSQYLLYNATVYHVNFSDYSATGWWSVEFLLGSRTLIINAFNSTNDYDYEPLFVCFWHPTPFIVTDYMWVFNLTTSFYPNLLYTNLDSLGNTGSLSFTASEQDGGYPITIVFVWDNVKYATPSAACDGDEMTLLVGLTIDQLQTKTAGINLIAALLFFNLPNVHPYINYILGLTVWTLIAVLIVMIIRSFIPFL